MGLATGIDYALFVVTRFRRELAAGNVVEGESTEIETITGQALPSPGDLT